MKRLTFATLFVLAALLLASCSFHTGLSSILKPGGDKPASTTKKVKATHTPPSPSGTAAASTPAAAASANTVSITGSAFNPNVLQVAAGTTVTWVNTDAVQHTVTSDTKLFDSGPIDPGAKFTYTFTAAGSYAYHCSIHTTLTGSVTVQ